MEFVQTLLLKAGLMMLAGILFVLYGASWVSYGLRIYKTKGKDIRSLFTLYFLTLVAKSQIMSLTSRRDVIKTLALGTGGLILSPKILRSASIYKKDRLGIALVG